MALARALSAAFPDARILFASFFAQAVELVRRDGFETLYFPDALRAVRGKTVPEERMRKIDAFCRKEYLGLNAMLNMERFLPRNREGARAFLHEHIIVLDGVVGEATLGISSMYDHFVYLAAGMLAFEKNGGHFAFVGCGVPSGRVVGLRTPCRTWQNPLSTEEPGLLLKKAREEITLPSEERIEYMKPRMQSNNTLLERVRLAWGLRRFALMDARAGTYFPTGHRYWPLNSLHWRANTRMRRMARSPWDVAGDSSLARVKGPCVFLALHMEPEATILMYSPRWRDQEEICRLVSEALPLGYTLLVKENPKMAGKRPFGYYDRIKRLSNVKLVATTVPSSALIDRSEAVVSLAGTITVEARLRGKPAYCFGRPPFAAMATATGAAVLDALAGLPHNTETQEDPAAFSAAWASWLRGTFRAKNGRNPRHPEMWRGVVDFRGDNVGRFAQFILGCLGAR